MKTFWYATLVTLTSLVLGALVSQSFGADRSGGRSPSGSARSVGQVRSTGLNAGGVSRKVGSSQGLQGFKPTTRMPAPVINPRSPISRPPVVGPIKPMPPIVKPPLGPIKPPVVGPIGPIGPIKPPVGPIKPPVGPIGPIKPPVGPIGPIKPPIVGPIGPIGPIKPLPPICPPYCPPKPCPPFCPPWNPGYCGPWYPLPGWFDCYHPCPPICVTVPNYVPVVTETVVVETAAPAVAVTEVASEDELMQVPVGATLQLNEKTLGEKQGQVVLQIETLSVPAQVNEWKAEQANVTLPMFGVSAPTKAFIWMMRADGQVANKLAVELIPAKAPAAAAPAEDGSATSAAVTQN